MADQPWRGDACSLVDAFRTGERSPVEELEASLAAIASSDLNAVCFIDADRALAAAERADVRLPFGGVPLAVKELDQVEGWPDTEASLVHAERYAEHTSTHIQRLRDRGGVVLVGQTTASEFGGMNIGTTKLHGISRNPWDPTRTTGGSSAGSAAAVAGGLMTLASGGDGGGSIRIPAAFNGLVGMKGTYGRIPRGPHASIAPMTVVVGGLCRSVRDVARWYDVASGHDSRDPYSLPRIDGWEAGLGTHLDALRGQRLAILPDLGGSAIVRDEVAAMVREAAEQLASEVGMVLVEVDDVHIPSMGVSWVLGNLAGLAAELGDRWPACRDDLTEDIAFGLDFAQQAFDLGAAGHAELRRRECNEAVAAIFDRADVVACATTPDVAFPAHVHANTRVGGRKVDIGNNLALTGPFNIVGNPACSVPIGVLDPWTGAEEATAPLPVGLQLVAPHHQDAALLDLALTLERVRPWPLIAPGR
jgi:aspartyl-tRNA(Asn)/glutamyl-tRNA(Gln) amidotransferase subunit A